MGDMLNTLNLGGLTLASFAMIDTEVKLIEIIASLSSIFFALVFGFSLLRTIIIKLEKKKIVSPNTFNEVVKSLRVDFLFT